VNSLKTENDKRGVERKENLFRGHGMQSIYPTEDMVALHSYERKDWMAGMS
jgi:hypothetical protein